MEEDNNKEEEEEEEEEESKKQLPSPAVSRREPLYELIGWKRNPPPVQLDLRGAKPLPPLPLLNNFIGQQQQQPHQAATSAVVQPPPAPPLDDVWVPRRDWVPPSPSIDLSRQQTDKPVWLRNQPINLTSRRNNLAVMEENPIYGRLWESNSAHNSSSSGRSSSSSADDIIKSHTEQPQAQTQPDLSGKKLSNLNPIQYRMYRMFSIYFLNFSHSIDGEEGANGALADDWSKWPGR